MNVQELFDHVQQLTTRLVKKTPDIDYESIANNIPLVIPDMRFPSWSETIMPSGLLYENITRKVLPLVEKTVNGHGEEQILHRNHFMIEIFRTPIKHASPDLCALVRIAFFLGLVRNNLRDSDFPEGVVRLFRDFKAWNLINFIEEGRTQMVSQDIIDDMEDLFL